MWNKIYITIVTIMVVVIVVALASRAGVFELRKGETESESDTPVSMSSDNDDDKEKETNSYVTLNNTDDLTRYEIGEKAICSFVPIEIHTDNFDEGKKRYKEFGYTVNSVAYKDKIDIIPDNLKGQITGINSEGLPEIKGEIFAVVNVTITNENVEDYTFWLNNTVISKMEKLDDNISMLCCYSDFSNWYNGNYFGVKIPGKGEFTTDLIYSISCEDCESDIALVIHPSGIESDYIGSAIIQLGKIKRN